MELNQTELVKCLERWASWAVKCKRFPKWEFYEIVSEGWILFKKYENKYDPDRSSLYTWLDRVLTNRLPTIYTKQTKMRVWKAGEGLDSLGRSSRPTTPYVETVSLENFFDQNLEDLETQSE